MFCSKSSRLISRNILKNRAFSHTKSKQGDPLNRVTSIVFSGFLTVGGISYYLAKNKREQRMEGCSYVPVDENYKATNVK
jgi:hypothetical protein